MPRVGRVLGSGDGINLDGGSVFVPKLDGVIVHGLEHRLLKANAAPGRDSVSRPGASSKSVCALGYRSALTFWISLRSLHSLTFGHSAVAHVLDVGERGRAVVGVVAQAVEMVVLQPDLPLLVQGQNFACQSLRV